MGEYNVWKSYFFNSVFFWIFLVLKSLFNGFNKVLKMEEMFELLLIIDVVVKVLDKFNR